MKVESVLAPFMGYLGAKQEGNPQLAQSRLSEMTKALDSLRQVQQVKLERARLPYDLQYQQAMGEQAIGYGKLKTAEADKIRQELANAPELQRQLQVLGEKLGMPDIIQVLASGEGSTAIKGATDIRQFTEAEKAGTFGAEAGQKTQEALLGGMEAETQLAEGVPLISAQAKGAEGRATIATAEPLAQAKLREQTAQAGIQETDEDMQRRLNEALIQSRQNMGLSSGVNLDALKGYSGIINQTTDNLGSVRNMISGLTKGASNNIDAFNLLESMNVSVPQITSKNDPQERQQLLDRLMQQEQRLARMLDIQGKTASKETGITPEFFGVEQPKPTANAIKNKISQQVWDALPMERQEALRKQYGGTLQIVPDTQTFSDRNRAKPTTPKTQTNTGNVIKSKPKNTDNYNTKKEQAKQEILKAIKGK